MMNKKLFSGMSLTEVLVAAVILALTMAGVANIFIAGKRYVLHSRSRMAGGELGKVLLDPLLLSVRQDTWDNAATNDLALGTRYCDDVGGDTQMLFCPAPDQRRLNGMLYSARYDITDSGLTDTGLNLRRVHVTINWNENPS